MSNPSARMQWPIPGKKDEPWLEAFQALISAMDTSGYAAREDRNIILMGGGTVAWNSGSGVLQWSATIQFLSSIAGALCQVAAGNVTIQDGQVCYVPLVRYPTSNTTVIPVVGNNTQNDDNSIVLCVRRGTQLYFRNGNVLKTGQSGALIENGGSLSTFSSLYSNAPATIEAGATGGVGAATAVSPGDHSHPVSTAGSGDIAAVTAAASAGGSSTKLARGDHRHQVTVAAPVSTGDANAEGDATSLARSNHVHKTLVKVGVGGNAPTGSRPWLNFVGATVSDNNGSDRIDITITPATSVGASGEQMVWRLPLAMNELTDISSWTVVGAFLFDPTEYNLTGTNGEFRWLVVGYITNAGLTGNVQLWNVTDSSEAGLASFNGGGDTSTVRKLITPTLPLSAKLYEVRIRVTGGGGGGSGDQLKCAWAGIQVARIFP